MDPSTHNNIVLNTCIQKGYTSLVHLLLKDSRMHCVVQDVNEPLLYNAVLWGNVAIIQAILKTGVERESDDLALLQAVKYNNITVTRILVKVRPTKEKMDALMVAVKTLYHGVVEILLQEKDVVADLKRGYTRLMMIAVKTGNIVMVGMLGKHLPVTDAQCNYVDNTTTMRSFLLDMQKTQNQQKTMFHNSTKST